MNIDEFFKRLGAFVLLTVVGNLASYLIPFMWALNSSYFANFDLNANQSALIDMYEDLDASFFHINPSDGAKVQFTDSVPEMVSSPFNFTGVKLGPDQGNRVILKDISLTTDLSVEYSCIGKNNERCTFILEGRNYHESEYFNGGISGYLVFQEIPNGIYTFSVQLDDSSLTALHYNVTGKMPTFQPRVIERSCGNQCTWPCSRHGERYAVVTSGGQNAHINMNGYYTYPRQLLYQSGEIIIVVIAFCLAFFLKYDGVKSRFIPVPSWAINEKAMVQV